MTVVAILADQHFRRGVPAPFGQRAQPIHGLPERGAFRRHVVLGGAFQNVARLVLQGAVVQRGASLEAVHHVLVELPHFDRRHRFAS